ncbi:hypothetical protein B5180_01210 [Streptomyces sp. BF-3]|nr:hypothetical protein B5180_01210 [Streptomyces sp. BF-3]
MALSGSYVWAVFLASAAGAIADGVGLGRTAGELLMERGFGWAVAFLLVLTWMLPAMGPRLVGPDEVLRPLSRSARAAVPRGRWPPPLSESGHEGPGPGMAVGPRYLGR